MAFATLMAAPIGRLLRITAGVAIIAWGRALPGTTAGVVLVVVGLVPLLAGVFNVCVFAPLLGAPLSGSELIAAPARRNRKS
jgi:hypothetical protein